MLTSKDVMELAALYQWRPTPIKLLEMYIVQLTHEIHLMRGAQIKDFKFREITDFFYSHDDSCTVQRKPKQTEEEMRANMDMFMMLSNSNG